MGSLNKVQIIGRLGKDPEIRYTQGGQAIASFSVATDSKWTNKSGEKQEKTEWHRVICWNNKGAQLADVPQLPGLLVHLGREQEQVEVRLQAGQGGLAHAEVVGVDPAIETE